MLARYIPSQHTLGRITKYSAEIAATDILDHTPFVPVRLWQNVHFTIQKATGYPHIPNTQKWSPASLLNPASSISTLPAAQSVIPSNTNHGCRVDLEFSYGGIDAPSTLLYTSHGENITDSLIPPGEGYVRLILSDPNNSLHRTGNETVDCVLLRILISRGK